MSKLLVYRASAGSGKTYRLAAEYLTQVVKIPESYSRILAVTFTNKATNEMKERILSELFALSNGIESDLGLEIMNTLSISKEQLEQRAKKALSLILHDYSHFSISTIDSFVQRVLQSLLWEIGQQGRFEIELDTNSVLTQAADNLIDFASENSEAMEWLTNMVKTKLDDGSSWEIRKELIELGKQLFSENFRLMQPQDIETITDRERVSKLKKSLDNSINEIAEKISNKGVEILREMNRRGISTESFFNGKRGLMGFVHRCSEFKSKASKLPETQNSYLQKALGDPTGKEWVNATTYKRAASFAPIESVVNEFMHRKLNELYDEVILLDPLYITTKLIAQNLNNLGLIGDLWHQVKELSKSEGFILINDSHQLLREFVKDSDTPFIYEKMGNRYDHFLIDEFQDTSVVQWHNFKPLISNSLAQGNFCMVVGDVKQSIYRWRNGDWRILSEGIHKDFNDYNIEEKFLNTNYRSHPLIVSFNNTFFAKALQQAVEKIEREADEKTPQLAFEFTNQIKNAYKDIIQSPKVPLSDTYGRVELKVIEVESKEKYAETLTNYLPQLILSLRERYCYGEIAILIRNKKEGIHVAQMLMEHNRNQVDNSNRIDFISQEGLLLKSSSMVRLIVAAMRIAQDQNNEIAKRELIRELTSLGFFDSKDWHILFSKEFIQTEISWLTALELLPLQEVFEALVNRYNLSNSLGEIAFLADMHEQILSFSSKGGASISRFLEWWDEKSEGLALNIPETNNALTLITIHKSKGLQFPVVIIPYASWDFSPNSKPPLVWVSAPIEPLKSLPFYPVTLLANAKSSLFAPQYLENQMQEIVDNLNLMYVAFTRPESELYIFSMVKAEKNKETKLSNTGHFISKIAPEITNSLNASETSEINCSNNVYSVVLTSDGIKKEKKGNNRNNEKWITTSYKSYSNIPKIRISQNSNNFFISSVSTKFEALEYGKLMHLVLSRIKYLADVRPAVEQLVYEGFIEENEKNEFCERINHNIAQPLVSNWYLPGNKVRTEATILTPDGKNYRPDRVLTTEKETIVVDYKFGEPNPKHTKQISQYISLLRQMETTSIKGYIWYVDRNEVVNIGNL
jgi:ATP-dependent exoDNAse (exonuclease V) beta subunit